MKRLLVLILITTVPRLHAAEDISMHYEWGQSIHAGGNITGMHIHPSGSPIYCRADVTDAYRWDAAREQWVSVVNARSMPPAWVDDKHPGVSSIVSAPSDPDRAYMAWKNWLFRSTNRGESWTAAEKVNDGALNEIKMEPNGDAKIWGERLAVDPRDADVVYFGSERDGLLRSVNGGMSWTSVPGVPTAEGSHGMSVEIDASSPAAGNGRASVIYVSVERNGIYRSTDGGASFSKMTGDYDPNGTYMDMALTSDGTMYACNKPAKKIFRYKNGSWADVSPSAHGWKEVAAYGSKVYAVDNKGGSNFVFSTDEGATWQSNGGSYVSPDVPWMEERTLYSHRTISAMVADPSTGHVWLGTGIGVYELEKPDTVSTTWVSRSKNIGELVMFDLLVAGDGKLLTASADKAIFHTEYDAPATDYYPHRFIAGWDLGMCYNQPNFVVCNIMAQPWNKAGAPFIGYSTDNGDTWIPFETIPQHYSFDIYAQLEVASNDPDNIVWLFHSNDGVLHYTKDRGKTWSQANQAVGQYHAWGAQRGLWSGTRYLKADPNNDNTFYVVNANADVYQSTDGGANWTQQNSTPLKDGFHKVYKLVPGKDGHLFYASGYNSKSDLYHSTDGGKNWSQVPGVTGVRQIAVGKAAPGSSYPTLFFMAEVDGALGLYLTTDKCQTWKKVADYPNDIFDVMRTMVGDMNRFGNVYAAFTSHGVVYGKYLDGSAAQRPAAAATAKPGPVRVRVTGGVAQLTCPAGMASVSIVNAKGAAVSRVAVDGATVAALDLRKLSKGFYLVQVVSSSGAGAPRTVQRLVHLSR